MMDSVIGELLDELGVAYKHQDISESDVLFERYGLLIPVLSHAGGGELNWPFESVQIREFMQRTKPE